MKSIKNQTILIIGAGLLQIPVIKTARTMGLKVIAADGNPYAPGLKYADHIFIASTANPENIIKYAKSYMENKKSIQAVFTAGTDASYTVAVVAEALNLPGIDPLDALAATNKLEMRKRFKKFNVPQPNFFSIKKLIDLDAAAKQLKYPFVIKPVDNMGARGVQKILNKKMHPIAFERAIKTAASGKLIAEEFMEGPELSIDALSFAEQIQICGIADRIIKYPPYFVETGHILPSNLPQKKLDEAIFVFKQGIKALNIINGAAKADIKVTPQGVKIGEIAARLSGGFMSAYTFPYASGINLTEQAIRIALGYKPQNLNPKKHFVSFEHAIIAKPGQIISISGIKEALKIKGIKDIFIKYNIGDIVKEPTNNVEKGGNIIACGKNRKEVQSIINKALKTIKISCIEKPAPGLHHY